MGTKFRLLDKTNDITATKTLIHEVIPITGSIVSGTYGTYPNDSNVKKYTHGMFQAVHDYPYLSSSANHIFDLTAGVWISGNFGRTGNNAVSASNANRTEKENIYAQLAAQLVGHDISGNIRAFDHLGELTGSSDNKFHSALFMPLSRLLVKDEIQKESFELKIGTSSVGGDGLAGTAAPGSPDAEGVVSLKDLNALTSFKSNSPAGEYAILYSGSNAIDSAAVGLIFYQAGVVVLELSASSISGAFSGSNEYYSSSALTALSYSGSFSSASIDNLCDSFRRLVYSMEFRNTTEVNSTIYFCRANHNEFNYSSNPTYVSASQLRVKTQAADAPVSYITSVGLYAPDGALLATAKLSEPLKKSPNNDFTIRVRLDY